MSTSDYTFSAKDFCAPVDGSFRIAKAHSSPPKNAPDDNDCEKQLKKTVKQLDQQQRRLYAQNKHAVLCVFQAMDAAGKDSTIRAVLGKLNPAGFQVYSFKAPSPEELDHDFLWRTACRLPERGRIGVFNRSYYEEVLVVRVHPEYIKAQRLMEPAKNRKFWEHRYESICTHEQHLTRNGTVILKFFLNVSKEEQRQRFLSRLQTPAKNWKFSAADLAEREHWKDYMHAYQQCINATSTASAPWHIIPADNKPFMRLTVAHILQETLTELKPEYPSLDAKQQAELPRIVQRLTDE
ncbi:MAG: polyphosphate kinase 2 family protein [Pseudomonadales bacterium]